MKVFIGSDHAAFKAKEDLKAAYHSCADFEMIDCGTFSSQSCSYPKYAGLVATHVQRREGKGLLLCGSGIGVSMVANRYAGVRAALCRTPREAQLSVEHNQSNILCMGSRFSSLEEMLKMIEAWLQASFQGGRHLSRISQFDHLGEGLGEKN